jgi:DNA ligase-1
MRLFAHLAEELESRPADGDRVAALARYLHAVGRPAGALAGDWLVVAANPARPARLSSSVLAEAARRLVEQAGTPPWLFEVGRAAATEAAEAIALLLPWPAGAPDTASRPALADWLACWRAAAAQPAAVRAEAVVAAIARLDDPLARRWAVRAACGQARPIVTEWQWQRAWAQAFAVEPRAIAWHWHRSDGRLLADAGTADGPMPLPFAALDPAPDAAHTELLAAWRSGDVHAEPRWAGARVQVVRRGADVAVWQRAGPLLNAALPAALLAAERWPDGLVVEAVLLARSAGRDVPLFLPRKSSDPAVTWHLALVDWHRWPGHDDADADIVQRRARLHARWPAPDAAALRATLPEVFTSPWLPPPEPVASAAGELAALAGAPGAEGWSGLGRPPPPTAQAWTVRPVLRRVRAVLQYVPGEALAATAAAASALAWGDCGFALWSRAPRSPQEQAAAMTAAMAGEFLPPPDDAPQLAGLRLLPIARLPIALPDDELQRLHAWLRVNAGQRFGGVHAVAPALVFELGFTALRESRRHKSGVVVECARVLGWLADAPPGAAQRIDELGACSP